jgi:hypothetical protein
VVVRTRNGMISPRKISGTVSRPKGPGASVRLNSARTLVGEGHFVDYGGPS